MILSFGYFFYKVKLYIERTSKMFNPFFLKYQTNPQYEWNICVDGSSSFGWKSAVSNALPVVKPSCSMTFICISMPSIKNVVANIKSRVRGESQ